MISIIDKIRNISLNEPNKTAYVVGKDKITYKYLYQKANTYASYLKKQDSKPIILYGDKEIEMIISIIACLISNRPYIPIGTCTPKERIEKIIKLSNASLIITKRKIDIEDIEIKKIEDLIEYNQKDDITYKNDIAYIISTSGSTGEPKCVPISISNLENFTNWISKLNPLKKYKNKRVLNQASFSFDLSVADIYYSLYNGHTLVTEDKSSCSFLTSNNIFAEEKINIAVMTPTYMKLCLVDDSFNEKTCPDFECVYFCGEQLEPSLVKKIYKSFPNLKIINAYGPTEATSAISAILITKEMCKDKILPVGEIDNLASNVEIIEEEIVIKGNSVFNGYLGNVVGGYYQENNINCYKTGDIGYIENKKIYCIGRKDSQIKYKGYRIELNDIEYNLKLIDGVDDAAVVAKYNENNIVKTIKAYVVSNKETNYIKEKLGKKIPSYMMPKTIVLIDKLPLNQNGKIDRKALQEL